MTPDLDPRDARWTAALRRWAAEPAPAAPVDFAARLGLDEPARPARWWAPAIAASAAAAFALFHLLSPAVPPLAEAPAPDPILAYFGADPWQVYAAPSLGSEP